MCAVVVRYHLTLDLCEQTDLAIDFYNILLALLEGFSLLFIYTMTTCPGDLKNHRNGFYGASLA